MDDSHTERTLRGVNWSLLRVLLQTFLSLGVTVVLARLLPPADFGLFAIVMIFIGFAELSFSLGMGPAIIQRETIQDQDLRSAGTLSTLIGSSFLILFWILAPAVADFFGDERITLILWVLAFGMWFNALSAVSRGLLMRRLDFRRLFFVDLYAYVFGYVLVSIPLAITGFGIWSLVAGALLSLLFSSIVVMYMVRPPLRPSLRGASIAPLLSFGAGISLKSTINYCASNVDYFVVGKFLTPNMLGLYTRAYQLVTLPLNKFAVPLSMVTFPAYSEIQADLPRLERAYLRVVTATVLLSFPVLTGFIVAGEYLIVGLFGDNWRAATPAFRILCLAAMFKTVYHLAGAVVEATGQVYAEVRRQSIYFLLLLVGCLMAVEHGIEAVAVAVTLSSLWLYLAMSQLVIRILNSRWRRFLKAHIPGLAVSAVVALASAPLALAARTWIQLPESLVLILLIVVSTAAFLTGLLFLPARLLGDMPGWIMTHYGKHVPTSLRSLLARRSRHPGVADSTHD